MIQAWPTVHTRLTQLFSVVDPAPPQNGPRASLTLGRNQPKKALNSERDISMHLWKNYITFACRVVPQIQMSSGAVNIR